MFGWSMCAMPVGANTVLCFLQFSQQFRFVLFGIHLGYKCLWNVMASASSLLLYLHLFILLNGRKQLAFLGALTHILCQYYFFAAVMNTDSGSTQSVVHNAIFVRTDTLSTLSARDGKRKYWFNKKNEYYYYCYYFYLCFRIFVLIRWSSRDTNRYMHITQI